MRVSAPYCITVPTTDPRLTGIPSELCGLYDRNDRGANFTLTQLSDAFGKSEDVYDGFDVNVMRGCRAASWRRVGSAAVASGRTTAMR